MSNDGEIIYKCCPIYGDSLNSVCSRGTKGCVEDHSEAHTLSELNESLLAQVEELRVCEPCPCGDVGFFVVPNNYNGEPEQEQCEHCYTNPKSRFNALNNTSQQSLNSLKAATEQSTIYYVVNYLRGEGYNHEDILYAIRNIPRKHQT
jgi:hypothetical protein